MHFYWSPRNNVFYGYLDLIISFDELAFFGKRPLINNQTIKMQGVSMMKTLELYSYEYRDSIYLGQIRC
jgi:hypothetical protein